MNHRQPTEVPQVSVSFRRYLPMLLAVCLGVGLSLTIFFVVRWWEGRNIEKAFRLAAEDRAIAVKGTFETEVAMLELIRSAIVSDGRIGRREFQELLTPFISRRRSIQAVEWVPRVFERQRQQYVDAARRDGIEQFQITEMAPDGKLVPAARRSEYYPVYFIGPEQYNLDDRNVFGFDLASETTRRDALVLACDTGKTVASGRIAFVEDTDEIDGFLVLLPVYERGMPVENIEERRQNLLGFVVGVFRPGKMIEAALARLHPEGIDVCLYDPSAASDGRPFHFHSSRTRENAWKPTDPTLLYNPNEMHYVTGLNVAGHPWTVVCVPAPNFIAARRTWWSWGVLAIALAFTALLAAYLSLSIDRRVYLENKVRERTEDVRRAQEEIIYRLASASQWRDEETGMHIRRTGLFSESLARAAGWPAAATEAIRQAAPMHDVGKIGIPDAILQKPGKLTPEEFEVMKTHTTIGAKMLADSDVPMLQMARKIAQNHHERWDGTGYPGGLAGQEIPESARILAIVDVYDALTHDRVYRPAMSEDDVLMLMRKNAGSHFDPRLLSLFFEHLSEIRHIASAHPDELLKDTAVGQTQAPILPALSMPAVPFTQTPGA